MGTDEVMTLKEVGSLLKIAERTAYTMAQRGDLPGFKVGGQWRFKRADIDRWIEKQKAGTGGKSEDDPDAR
jgi:excisionase family DNA binding protein